MRKPSTAARKLNPFRHRWERALESDCTNFKKIALERFAREAKGAVPYGNRKGSTDSACRGAIGRLKSWLILWAGNQTWYDVNTIGKDNLHWVEDIMYAMLISGEDASHGKLFTVAQELKGQPWCLWTGGSDAKSFAKSMGCIYLSSEADSVLPIGKALDASRVVEHCHASKTLGGAWKAFSLGFTRQACKDAPDLPLHIVLNKKIDDAETSALGDYEVPAVSEQPPPAGIVVHPLLDAEENPEENCDEITSWLRALLEKAATHARSPEYMLREMRVFGCQVTHGHNSSFQDYWTPFSLYGHISSFQARDDLKFSNLITHLDLRAKGIDDKAAKAIASRLASSKITHLDLGYNRIGAEGAKAIANSLANSKIDAKY
jgi:hypothetical protein